MLSESERGQSVRSPLLDAACASNRLGPVELVVLQGTTLCNLDCSYCYLSRESRRSSTIMNLDDLRTVFANIFNSPFLGESLHISWHSGEPLTLKPEYYDQAIACILELARRVCRKSVVVRFDIQSNGTLLSRHWLDLFAKHAPHLTLGISCDGPAFLHDRYRRNWSGKSSHAKVVEAMNLLMAAGLVFDIISVVSSDTLDHPEAFLRFFEPYTQSIRSFHFNLLDEIESGADQHEAIVNYGARYEQFLRGLLTASCAQKIKIRNFAAFYERVFASEDIRKNHGARNMSIPFKTLNVQPNGEISTFYAGLTGDECRNHYGDGKGLLIGNLLKESLSEIAQSPKLERIRRDFEQSHAACEKECSFHSLCSGGYNLVKLKRYGRFDVSQTPECFVTVQTFLRVMLEEMEAGIASSQVAENRLFK